MPGNVFRVPKDSSTSEPLLITTAGDGFRSACFDATTNEIVAIRHDGALFRVPY